MGVALPLTSRMCCSVTPKSVARQLGLSKLMMRVVPPPSSVIRLPPSITVFLLMGRLSVSVTWMVTLPPPQSKVITPPAAAAVRSAANVQLDAVPVPTTVVGLDVSAGWPLAGTPALHDPLGLPAPPVEDDEPPFPPPGPPPPLPPGAGDPPPEPQPIDRATGTTRARNA